MSLAKTAYQVVHEGFMENYGAHAKTKKPFTREYTVSELKKRGGKMSHEFDHDQGRFRFDVSVRKNPAHGKDDVYQVIRKKK